MPTFRFNDAEIAYQIIGNHAGPTVLLSHCLAGDARLWDPQVIALRNEFRLITYDLRGHGRSSVTQPPYSIAGLAADALALLDYLAIDRIHFVGLSLGGMIGQALAASAPERIQSLVLIACASSVPPPGTWEERAALVAQEGVQALVPSTLERWFSGTFRASNPEVVKRVAGIIGQTPSMGYIGCAHAIARAELSGMAKSIRKPTLILYGEDDPGIRRGWAEEMHESITGSQFVVLPRLRHHPSLEGAEVINRLISSFVRGIHGAV